MCISRHKNNATECTMSHAHFKWNESSSEQSLQNRHSPRSSASGETILTWTCYVSQSIVDVDCTSFFLSPRLWQISQRASLLKCLCEQMKKQKSTVRSLNCVFLCTQQVTSHLKITSDFNPVEREAQADYKTTPTGREWKNEEKVRDMDWASVHWKFKLMWISVFFCSIFSLDRKQVVSARDTEDILLHGLCHHIHVRTSLRLRLTELARRDRETFFLT